ncbi:DUF2062 domain-containing protein [Paracoccus spongiarum]|uniref:DUF2062 domain-containing protein n=1 Tax=Paracoccus spongiarum TaxID=3064387 RepID=A0ABT9JAD7_9RHOB|nr:DUF2062 domain-containing protein [Paracoccus sp. 2205BS29-5]MDP5306772.1 DUF2062 domain-containing protein [Paracoccus sp. 2205BS29-5]
MFKRRKPRSYGQMASDMIYPPGGWRRAGTYVLHRVRRLPDQPHRIGRGVAAGVFVSFTPLFGLHFLSAAAVAWLIGGNVLAALLATFVGNPVTFPFIAVAAVGLGREILGYRGDMGPQRIFGEFAGASTELWNNLESVFGPERVHWGRLIEFFQQIYWPYMVGGALIGLLVSVAAHYLTVPVIRAYHRRREKKMAWRIEKVRTRGALVTTARETEAMKRGGAAPRPADSPRDISRTGDGDQ